MKLMVMAATGGFAVGIVCAVAGAYMLAGRAFVGMLGGALGDNQ